MSNVTTSPASPAPTPTQQAAATPVTPGTPAWSENPRARAHSPARDHWEQVAERAASPQDRPAAADPAAAAPAGVLSAEKQKVGQYEISESELAAMMTRQAADDLRKATVPTSPDGYKLEISPDAKLPGNVEIKFDGNDPGLVAAKAWAHSKGLDQSAFSEMLTLYASHVAAQEEALAAAARAEISKAGANAGMRVDAIGRWIRAEVGDADARPILASLVTDSHLRFYEKLQQRISSQGAASFSQSHRVPPDNKSIPGYENMSFEQRRFAQDQLAQQRR
jgi:hypothetical protein